MPWCLHGATNLGDFPGLIWALEGLCCGVRTGLELRGLLGLTVVGRVPLLRGGLTVAGRALDGGRRKLLLGPGPGAVRALTCRSTSPTAVAEDDGLEDGLGSGSGFGADVEGGGGNGSDESVTACLGGDFRRESKRMSFWIF